MISPSKQKIIQIEVTNACPHSCSNCTRFSGHHKKPFNMTISMFKQAVNSLMDFTGMVGIMGGEPTLHPKFDKLVEFLKARVPDADPSGARYKAIRDFSFYRNDSLSDIKFKRGLWTSLGSGYSKHYELIQDVFNYQCINDHRHAGKHMALLVSRKELGIPDTKWLELRNDCWLQREWSASITPKGAFFCEVAAALDMLFDGPGGWDVEPGWWMRKPEDFGDQLQWCEMCGAALAVPSRVASDGVDDITPGMVKKLKELGSAKIKKGMYEVIDVNNYSPDKFKRNTSNCEPYIPNGDNSVRVSDTSGALKKKKIDAVIACVGYDDYLNFTLPYTVSQVSSVTVVTTKEDKATIKACKAHGAKVVISKRFNEGGAAFAKGKALNDALKTINKPDWILMLDADVILKPGFCERIEQYVLNPGALYFTRRWGPFHYDTLPGMVNGLKRGDSWDVLYKLYASKKTAAVDGRDGNDIEHLPFGYFQLFNVKASVLKDREVLYPEASNTAEYDDMVMGFDIYNGRAESLPVPEFDIIHLPHGLYQENWSGRRSPRLEAILRLPSDGLVKPVRYKCRTKCYYGGKVYRPGDVLTSERWDVPKHFENMKYA